MAWDSPDAMVVPQDMFERSHLYPPLRQILIAAQMSSEPVRFRIRGQRVRAFFDENGDLFIERVA